MVIRLFLFAFFLTISQQVHALEVIHCEGTLPVFRGNGNHWFAIKPVKGRFQLNEQNALYLTVGISAEKPFLRISVWDTIDFKKYPANYASEFELEARVDAPNAFSVKLLGKDSGILQTLLCVRDVLIPENI